MGAIGRVRPSCIPEILKDLSIFAEWWDCQREAYLCETLRDLYGVTKSCDSISQTGLQKSKSIFFQVLYFTLII